MTTSGIAAKARALYGFSRGTQATLSLAQPATAALLAAGLPSVEQGLVGAVAALAGFYAVVVAVSGWLVVPARWLLARPTPATALAAFNRASFHPVLVFAGTALGIWLRPLGV